MLLAVTTKGYLESDTVFQRMGGGGKRRRGGGEIAESWEETEAGGEKGREGGVGDFPLTFSNTQTHAHRAASPGCSHGKIPAQPQKAALLGREGGHMGTAANQLQGSGFKLWLVR